MTERCCPRKPWGEGERMPDPIYPYRANEDGEAEECQICGEPADGEMGEFGLPEGQTDPTSPGSVTIVAHGQCGIDHGLQVG